ncbi:hypothetical protein D3C85_1804410 [compost metagenome]
MQGQMIRKTPVCPPSWLDTNSVDAVLISIERSEPSKEVRHQIIDITRGKTPIFTWQELILLEMGNSR